MSDYSIDRCEILWAGAAVVTAGAIVALAAAPAWGGRAGASRLNGTAADARLAKATAA